MVVIKFQGGLGNQLFQFAFGVYLKRIHHKEVFFDLSYFTHQPSGDTSRKFKLPELGFKINELSNDALLCFQKKSLWSNFPDIPFVSKLLDKTDKLLHPYYTFYEEGNQINDLLSKVDTKKNVLLIGYWQYNFITEAVRQDLISLFKTTSETFSENYHRFLEFIKQYNTAAIHIRRGDYLNSINDKRFNVLGIDYFKSAKALLQQRDSKMQFLVFSDDIAWAKEQLGTANMLYAEGIESDIDEFQLMKKCHSFIISNSTFSWWPAWLNTTSSKMVIAPKQWYHPSVQKTLNIIPEDWITV